MASENNKEKDKRKGISIGKTILISLGVLVAGGLVVLIIFLTEPAAVREGATRQTAMPVDIIQAEKGSFRPEIVVTGTVVPVRDIILSPRISGQVMSLSKHFTPGGYVRQGQSLLQIDSSDYRNIADQRKSELLQAEAELSIEMGHQQVARQDYKVIDSGLAGKNKALVLREPQLNSARARVQSAQAAYKQALLNLQRTEIKAPFDALIISRYVNEGSQVNTGDQLARMTGTDKYWIEATVPLPYLRWLEFPGSNNEKGSEVIIRNRTAWTAGEYRKGYLYKMTGTLEDQTRMASVLIDVSDPLAIGSAYDTIPPLIIGSFVEALIRGKEISDVIRLNRDYVRKDGTLWLMKDSLLNIRKINIIFSDTRYSYIRGGVEENDSIIVSNLATVADSARLKLRHDSSSGGAEQ